MNLTSMLKIITILGWLLQHTKLDDSADQETRRLMNRSLLDIFAEVLSESDDAEFVVGVLAAGKDEDAGPEAEKMLDDIKTAIEDATAAEAENAKS